MQLLSLKRGWLMAIALSCFLSFSFILTSCSSQKKVMDSWLGSTKRSLIMSWGPPARTTSDGGTGEVLIYANQAYDAYNRISYYKYTMFYVYPGGTIYHWLTRTERVPPQQVNVDFYPH